MMMDQLSFLLGPMLLAAAVAAFALWEHRRAELAIEAQKEAQLAMAKARWSEDFDTAEHVDGIHG
jgi:hypothetical protein